MGDRDAELSERGPIVPDTERIPGPGPAAFRVTYCQYFNRSGEKDHEIQGVMLYNKEGNGV